MNLNRLLTLISTALVASWIPLVASAQGLQAPASLQDCSGQNQAHSLHERLTSSSISFIGTVLSIDQEALTFRVEHGIKDSKTGDKISFPLSASNACSHHFKVGERWLYSGHSLSSASLKLPLIQEDPLDHIGPLSRLKDDGAHLPSSWRECSDDEQCITIAFGCSLSAANTALAAVASKQTRRIASDHPPLQCMPPNRAVLPKAMCVNAHCGAWTAPVN